jgi:hypothetical protein
MNRTIPGELKESGCWTFELLLEGGVIRHTRQFKGRNVMVTQGSPYLLLDNDIGARAGIFEVVRRNPLEEDPVAFEETLAELSEVADKGLCALRPSTVQPEQLLAGPMPRAGASAWEWPTPGKAPSNGPVASWLAAAQAEYWGCRSASSRAYGAWCASSTRTMSHPPAERSALCSLLRRAKWELASITLSPAHGLLPVEATRRSSTSRYLLFQAGER